MKRTDRIEAYNVAGASGTRPRTAREADEGGLENWITMCDCLKYTELRCKVGPRLRELAPAARGGQGARSRNLADLCSSKCTEYQIYKMQSLPKPLAL